MRSRYVSRCPGGAKTSLALAVLLLAPLPSYDPAFAGNESDFTRTRWEHQVRRRGVDPSSVPYPLDYTEEMAAFAREASGTGGPLEQLHWLHDHLFDEDRFPFDYESRGTYTAIEAFEKRTGNCVSFTNLFIALGRSLGHRVRAALPTFRGESELAGQLIVVNTHIVAVYERNSGFEVFDFSRLRERQRVGLELIDDLRVTAIYLNNLGAEALFRNDTRSALHHLELAVKLDPEFAAAYGNLGVVRRRLGDTRGAIEAYLAALEVEPGYPSILSNLAALYQSEGRDREARAALKAARLRGATPYLLIIRGDFELSEGRPRAALKLYKRAARLAPELPEAHLAVARAQRERNRLGAARKAVNRALALDPGNEEALRLLQVLGFLSAPS